MTSELDLSGPNIKNHFNTAEFVHRLLKGVNKV